MTFCNNFNMLLTKIFHLSTKHCLNNFIFHRIIVTLVALLPTLHFLLICGIDEVWNL
uniref:Uncharacterized protein n=1 Tax=Octopus bimaculoides TaxID=37653 RepID=A0A0L8G6B4_OCTBM